MFSRTTYALLQRIHYDIVGPSLLTSCSGFRYYIIFLDDFRRFNWVYPMKLRTNCLESFKHSKTYYKSLLSAIIKNFQYDNALELVKGSLREFLDECKISVA